MTQEKGSLSINSENIFPIIKKWLYSDQDIFIRELISNGVDAIAKLRKLASLGEATVEENPEYRVDVVLNPEDKLITITDNGIGMTDEEVKKYINQIAFSGAAEFMEKYKESAEDPIIGHFGLGFYSAFMVSPTSKALRLSTGPVTAVRNIPWRKAPARRAAQPSPSMSTRTAKSISKLGKCGRSLKSTALSCPSRFI